MFWVILAVLVLLAPAAAALISWLIFTFIWNINDELRAKISAWRIEKANS